MSSYDVVRHFKRSLPQGYGKIGHFGTLDPFACGVLMIGIGGAARLNDFIHDHLPKTYLAIGKLGIETPTGDHTSEITQRDDSPYLRQEIARLPASFLEERLREKFLGPYLQAPHKYSASKFMGKNLHEWAREGIEVKKEAVLRHVHDLAVVRYRFPYLSIRVTVSSGTYVRTLFSEVCQDIGTLGSLVGLLRESVGHVTSKEALRRRDWPKERDPMVMARAMRADEVLPFAKYRLDESAVKLFRNGVFLDPGRLELGGSGLSPDYFWMVDGQDSLLGLSQKSTPHELRPKINFHSMGPALTSSDHVPE